VKVGYQGQYLQIDLTDYWNNHNVWYRFNNGVPNRVTMTANPATVHNRAEGLALYAQDQWTRGQLTLQGGCDTTGRRATFPSRRSVPRASCRTPMSFPRPTASASTT